MSNEIAPKMSLDALVSTWTVAQNEIREAHRLLKQAEERLTANLDGRGHCRTFSILTKWNLEKLCNPDELIEDLKRQVWRVLVERMEIMPHMSVKRAEELQTRLSSGELPDITAEQITAMMGTAHANIPEMMREAVCEVFDFLRPNWRKQYKTNSQFAIGKRVILSNAVECRWGGGFTIYSSSYSRSNRTLDFRALDNVFLQLDGKGIIKTYDGALSDAIRAAGSDGLGETDYFKFKCCKNGNLHIEFKRPDLVKELNKIAGGNRLNAAGAS